MKNKSQRPITNPSNVKESNKKNNLRDQNIKILGTKKREREKHCSNELRLSLHAMVKHYVHLDSC